VKKTRRREFLASSLGGLAALGTRRSAAVRASSDPPTEQIGVAVIGANGMGHGHVKRVVAQPGARLAAICDVDESVLERAAATATEAGSEKPKLVGDFRTLLDDDSVDAVIIAVPHHSHVPIAMRALKAGKDVYVEKPASHVFKEGRLLIDAARKYGRIVQHGTQMRSTELTFRAEEVLKSGILGEVKMSKAWNCQRGRALEPKPDGPAPPGVDYDMWLGPAPKRAFNPNRFHKNWQLYRDYGNGDSGDDAAHDLDMARWGLGVTTHPVRITSHGSRIDLVGEREFPDNMTIAYQYADDKVLLYEDRLWTPYGLHGVDNGNAFYGTEGYMIFSRRGYFRVYLGRDEKEGPALRGKEYSQNAQAHVANFVDCVRTRKEPNASAEVAHLSCALIHLGEIGNRLRRVVEFDPKSETIPGDAEANAMLTKEYRAPWSPEVA
jgi:predicted dehydrogenase